MTKPGPKPPSDIKTFLQYDRETGMFLRISHRKRSLVGTRADLARNDGYRTVRFKNRLYAAHRLAWFFETGVWSDQQIDHRNRDKHDNRIANLREATPSQNRANTGSVGAVPFKGVTTHKQTGKFQAQIKLLGKNRHLGLFATPEAAHAAYLSEARKAYGEFAAEVSA